MPRRRSVARLLPIVILLVAPLLAAPGQPLQDRALQDRPLQDRIAAVLSAPDLARGFWGIEVVSLSSKTTSETASDKTTGKTLYSQNADKLFTPASNTKLFTTAAALALIGPDYKFHTTVETTGTLDRYGRLNGDLVLVGHGDPNLSGRELPYDLKTQRNDDPIQALEALADALVQKGVKFIDGDIVADDSYFAFERYGEGWSQDDLVWADGAPVSALTINDNVVFVNILPADRPGEKAFVSVKPFAEYYRLDNRIITTPAGTGRKFFINREPGSTVLTLWGNMPLDDAGANEALAIEDPAEFAAGLFRQLLEKRGIVIYGRQRTRHTELATLSTFSVTALAPSHGGSDGQPRPLKADQPITLASYESKPLLQDVRVINKVSQNLHAEILLRLLGRERGNAGTIEGGLEVLRGFLTQAGISNEEYVFYDGSGLSRQNLVTPHAIVELLSYCSRQPWGADYKATFPIAGVDGSLTERLASPRLHGRVLAKTGSLGGVKTLSGYATTDSGQVVVFSILSNNFNLPPKRVTDAIDELVQAIVDDVPAGPSQAARR
ncbi:MAG: D-alanyl-D-alanine carboxypeptidase/D-alanyl-D-alanine-endopeptidase [Terriglobales bacterium]|jgi:D-alanyl-D-alanine carboxypeptidase/D-alanyl-D-alanine-endopeptidase (penicillin-binding protein 4)